MWRCVSKSCASAQVIGEHGIWECFVFTFWEDKKYQDASEEGTEITRSSHRVVVLCRGRALGGGICFPHPPDHDVESLMKGGPHP